MQVYGFLHFARLLTGDIITPLRVLFTVTYDMTSLTTN